MKTFLIIAAALIFVFALGACGSQPHHEASLSGAPEPSGVELESGGACSECSSDPYYVKITAEAAKIYIDSSNPIVVDVRTKEEYDEGHIEGAINMPVGEIGEAAPELLPKPDAFILVYCRTGARSKQAAEKLMEMGYLKVYDMGGVADWSYGLVSD